MHACCAGGLGRSSTGPTARTCSSTSATAPPTSPRYAGIPPSHLMLAVIGKMDGCALALGLSTTHTRFDKNALGRMLATFSQQRRLRSSPVFLPQLCVPLSHCASLVCVLFACVLVLVWVRPRPKRTPHPCPRLQLPSQLPPLEVPLPAALPSILQQCT